MSALWWHRVASYLLRIVLPASLLSQLVGSIVFGRSSPGGFAQSWIDCVSVAVVCVSFLHGLHAMDSPGRTVFSNFRYAIRIPICLCPV